MKEKKEMEIVVSADTTKAKTSLQRLADYFDSNFKDEESAKLDINTTEARARLVQVNGEISQLKSELKTMDIEDPAFGQWAKQLENAETEAGRLKNIIKETNKIKPSFFETSLGKLKESSKGIDDFKKKMSSAFERSSKKAKKFVFSLIGIRTIWLAITRASRQYLSENEETANKMKAVWSYLGNLMGPIIERIVSWLQYGILYLNKFIKALSGIDLLAKAIAKNTAKSAKSSSDSMKKTLSSMDEIVNLDLDNGSGGGSDNVLKGLEDIANEKTRDDYYQMGKEFAESFNKGMENINWDYIRKQSEKAGKNLADYLNGFNQNMDWNMMGSTIANGFNTAFDYVYGFVTTFDWSAFGQGLGEQINGFFDNFDWQKTAKTLSTGLVGMITSAVEFLKTVDWKNVGEKITDFILNIDWANIGIGIINLISYGIGAVFGLIEGILDRLWVTIKDVLNNPDKLLELGKNIVIGIKDGIKSMFTSIKNVFKEIITIFMELFGIHSPSTVFKNFGINIIQGLINGVNGMFGNVKNTFNNLKNSIASVFSNIGNLISNGIKSGLSKVSQLKSILGFATGGFPDEGQMFIANEAGPELVGNIGGSTAVVNNAQIVESVSQGVANAVAGVLGNQKTTDKTATYLYINGSEFAKAVYGDMQTETQRRNANASIRRV